MTGSSIRSKIEAAQFAASPSSALSKACQYALAPLWKKLTRFLEIRLRREFLWIFLSFITPIMNHFIGYLI